MENKYEFLSKYAIDLNDRAAQGKLDPVIGRDDEIRRVLQILSRRTKNNPILVGEPGVGKTAISEGIAQKIVNGQVPETLKDRKIWALDMGALIAGAKISTAMFAVSAPVAVLVAMLGGIVGVGGKKKSKKRRATK